jgi:hypothetical protein
LDLAAVSILVEHFDSRDYKRLESLIKSLAAMATGLLGGDPKKILESGSEETEANGSGPVDPNDNPNVW